MQAMAAELRGAEACAGALERELAARDGALKAALTGGCHAEGGVRVRACAGLPGRARRTGAAPAASGPCCIGGDDVIDASADECKGQKNGSGKIGL